MKYTVNCQDGCGRHLGWLDLPDRIPLSGQDKGYLCEDCARKRSESRPPIDSSPLSKEQQISLAALKESLGPTGSITADNVDQLLAILMKPR